MKQLFNNLMTLRLTNPNCSKYCDVRFNCAKNEILHSKTYDKGKLLEYKHNQNFVKYSHTTGLPITSAFEDTKIKIIRNFQKNSHKLKTLFKLNKETSEKYAAEFDKNENLIGLFINNPKNKKYTHITMNEFGDIIDIKGNRLEKDIANIKYNRRTSNFEFRTPKQVEKIDSGVQTDEILYIDNLNGISKHYSTYSPNNPAEPTYAGVKTYIEKNGDNQLIENVIYDKKTKEMLLHEIADSNGNCVYAAVKCENNDGSKIYRVAGSFNNDKTIEIKRPDKI